MRVSTPEEFGAELRTAREEREVSREQLSASTKISSRQIEALECGRFTQLPALVFARGFVRAIAQQLALDPEQLSARFVEVHGAWADAERERQQSRILTLSGPLRLSRPRRAVSNDTTVRGLAIAAVLAVVTGGAVLVKSRSDSRPAPEPAATQATQQRAERTESGPASLALPPEIAKDAVPLPAEPIAREAAVPVLPSSSASGERALTLTLTFRDDCWTEVHADGKLVAAELFKKGARREFNGGQEYTLTLGNAGGVELQIDGRAVRPLGTAGQVVRDVVIDAKTGRPIADS